MARKSSDKRYFVPGQLPLLRPESAWSPVTALPDLRGRGQMAIDVETKDDRLALDRGSGWAYGAGHLTGVTICAGGESVYAPLTHPDTQNFEPDQVERWVRDHMKSSDVKIFHKADYDLGWLGTEWGIEPPEKIADTSGMIYMLDENRLMYNLDSVCRTLGIEGKDETLLREAARIFSADPKREMYRLPGAYVGPYAEQDGRSTEAAYLKMLPMLAEQDLMPAYQLEMDLIPTSVAMRRRGIRIDIPHAERTADRLIAMSEERLVDLSHKLGLGRRVTLKDIGSIAFLERVFDDAQIPYPRTPKSKRGSFGKEWMKDHEHWLPRLVYEAKELHRAGSQFVREWLIGFSHMGRIHAEIHQFKTGDADDDMGGTSSYRYAYSDPPLQQMPARHELIAKLVRQCFLPEEGHVWGAPDYSQQEYRLIVHFANRTKMAGVEKAVQMYRDNPKTSFHKLVAKLTGLPYKPAKDTNFAKAFGAGVPKFALMTNKTLDEAKKIYEQYDKEMPFVSRLAEHCQALADRRGWIRLLDGARAHFDQWEPRWREYDKEREKPSLSYNACSLGEAMARVKDPEHPWSGRLRRAYTHKAMNRLIQGSAARQTKMAIRECAREGILPLIQMHDELGLSCPEETTGRRVAEIMRSVVTLDVPVMVDLEFGPTWGDAKVVEEKDGTVTYDASWAAARALADKRRAA